MAKKNTKSRYWVDDNSILPEIVVTPQGNYPILDEAGNPARTVGAIQDINPNAHIYERVNTQPFMDDYIEGETNAAANQRADALDAQVVPHIGDFVSAATKPLDALMPSRWVGLLDKDYNGLSAVDRFSRLFDENNRGLFINDNPYGLFSKRYAEEHPYWAMAGNTAFDIASTPFIINGAKKAYNVGKTAYNNGKKAFQTIEPSIVRGDTAKDNIGFASLDTEINSKLPAALKAVKAMKKADADVAKMSEYHAKNVEAYNEATGSDIIAKPFRTDYSTREIKVLPKEEFNETVGRIKTNSPSADIENIGGLYHKRMDTVFLRNNGTPSNAYHEFLHSNYYGVTNPEVTKWRIRQLVDSQTEAKMSPTSKAYFLSESEFPVHLRQQGELMGINVGDPFPGEEAFDSLLHKYPARGASYYTKGVQEGASLEDKKLLWKALNGTLFGGIGAIAGAAYDASQQYGVSQQDNNVRAYGGLLELANKYEMGGDEDTQRKYYYKPEESGYYAPELMVTPDISYPAAVLSNGDFGVTYGTLKDMGVPVYYSKEKPYNQDYNEGITQSAASALADKATALKFPSLSDLREYYSLPKIRERLFLGVRPQGYGDDRKKEAFSAITGLGYNNLRKQRTTENPIIESLWAEYLQQPSYMINELYPNLPQNYLIGKSDYVPTINGSSSDNYLKINSGAENYGKHPVYRNTKGNSDIYKLDMPFDFVDKFVKNGYERSHIGGNKDFPEYNYNLGEYIGTRGMDDRGDYVSYYDKWDLSPFGGTEDQSMGIGKPLNIYDRVYLDDYYGVSEPTHATYLPEVEVTPNSHSQGGSLKPKFWNDLSMKEKSEMIRVAVNEGITDIGEIRNRYNEYAESLV